MLSKLNDVRLSLKLTGVAVVTVAAVLGVTYVVFLSKHRDVVLEDLRAKAAGFTAVADEAKAHVGKLHKIGAFNTAELVAEAQAEMAKGKSYRDTRFFPVIPVVAGWTAAREAAAREGIEFRVTAFHARNKDNLPPSGSFREKLLKDLESQVAAGGKDGMSRVDEATNTLFYMRTIRLEESCMMCHGDPAVYGAKDEKGVATGKDPLGFPMEGWKVGDTHGAFEVAMPLKQLDQSVAGFLTHGLMISVPVGAALLGVFAWLLRSMVIRPIASAAATMKDVATGEGDLTRRLSIARGDEIGQMGKWFDAFMEQLRTLVSEVQQVTGQVAAASTEIAASSEEMAAGLKSQEEQAGQVSSAVEEMSQSVTEVARKSADASKAAEHAGGEATTGGKVVEGTVAEMKAIADQVGQSADAIVGLGQRSEEIGRIVGVINDIAEQTNLLALNAAIEAARAGEHGRGFAVVADEVRKLAERTTRATSEVSGSIREVQSETDRAVEKINAGAARVGKGVELASSAGAALSRIVSGSVTVREMVGSIAAAAEQQSAASGQIARSVEAIASVTRETTEAAGQSARAAADLSAQAEKLRQLVGRFKV